ncbi:helicase-related protein [Miniimonas sp. S16]|uniref:helicase-related protein n=1 Tax=Miniimonas sp. S16 TaxID=2171623 RepID=UPI000D529919|nr:helicase-related protein [Miniimonas sp. S16]
MTTFSVGTLVRARGREWVVLPDSTEDFLVLRPLAGADADIAGVLPQLEPVVPASFPPPSADDLGDARSASLLRDALRIGFRSTGGPFRSLASLAVDPRPYQYVPLMLALRQETVRLLIADDVGIGKTVEAGLVAAELLAQGSARGLTVLCPPALAEQWQAELREKFGLEAELVLGSTVQRLERGLEFGQSIFQRHPFTIVSTDFIKADRRRDDFLRAAPDLVIVDEAHGCVVDDAASGGRSRTQRYRLLTDLAADVTRHLVLVTATPHSGSEGAFRNMLGLLDPTLREADLESSAVRADLARHLVQRRRADIRSYLDQDTVFPKDRQSREVPYRLTPNFRGVFDDAVAYARGQVTDRTGTALEQRVRWWSALSLLRAISSSPAAAAATLAARSAAVAADSVESADLIGRATVLDQGGDDVAEADDASPGAITTPVGSEARILADLAVRARTLDTDDDAKLTALTKQVTILLREGFSPIVFCRFIATAHYVAEHLRDKLVRTPVEVVTGELAPEDRSQRVAAMLELDSPKRVLVATDCLSEGVNLQEGFQAVVHYDLAWNPTRHEQREGRVDRFGQRADVVRAVTLYGEDNGIDGIVLDVLLRKHAQIRKDLGISVPVPSETNDRVIGALLEGVLLRGGHAEQLSFDLGLIPEAAAFEAEWSSAAEREKASRTRFAQNALRPEEVAREVEAARARLGSPREVEAFTKAALTDLGGAIATTGTGFTLPLHSLPLALQQPLVGGRRAEESEELAWFRDPPGPHRAAVLVRSDNHVGAVARFVLDGALDPNLPDAVRPARRTAVVTTTDVPVVTTLLLARFRVHVTLPGRHETRTEVAEEARALAFTGTPAAATWLDPESVERLLAARPTANTAPDRARGLAAAVLGALPQLESALTSEAERVAADLLNAHTRVRQSARGRDGATGLGVRGLAVRPELPVDLLGVFVYLPGSPS